MTTSGRTLRTAALALVAATGSAFGQTTQETRSTTPAAESRGATSRPASRPSSTDVPPGSTDPLTDGIKSVVGELIVKGFAEADRASLGDRIRVLLEIAEIGDERGRARESATLATTLIEIQKDYRPPDRKAGGTVANAAPLTKDETNRARIMAEALARDLRRRLPVGAADAGAVAEHRPPVYFAAPHVKPIPGFAPTEWQTLCGFEYEEGKPLPTSVLALDKTKVVVAGYMMLLGEVENVREFLLVQDLLTCHFVRLPKTHEVVLVRIAGRRGVEFTTRAIMIAGTLEVGEVVEDGFVTSLYRLRVDGPAGFKFLE